MTQKFEVGSNLRVASFQSILLPRCSGTPLLQIRPETQESLNLSRDGPFGRTPQTLSGSSYYF